MKIIYLNIDRGRKLAQLIRFILKESADTDIFCFQEFNDSIQKKIKSALDDFNGYFAVKYLQDKVYSNATFINKRFILNKRMKILSNDLNIGLIEIFNLSIGSEIMEFLNMHGIPYPGDKLDNPGRIKQSEVILEHFKNNDVPKIIGGDLNLMPGTRSLRLFELAGYRNLIKEFRIKSTRTGDSWKLALSKNKKEGITLFERQLFADYVFISSKIKVNKFSVPNINISNHLPMILEFDFFLN